MPKIKAGNLITDYSDVGTGLPVIFIPGITEFKEAFVFQSMGLKDSYRVISYDLRRGLKRASDYTLDALVEDLKNFLHALNIRSAVICGHSFGGMVAMRFALQYPQETNALILISAFPSISNTPTKQMLGWMSSTGHPFNASLGGRLKVNIANLLIRTSSRMLSLKHQSDAMKKVSHQAAQVANTTINQRLKIIRDTDLTETLANIVPPTLIIAGSKDKSFFLSGAQKMYENIPNSTLEVIENCGHFCFLTRHDLVNSIIDEYLKDRIATFS